MTGLGEVSRRLTGAKVVLGSQAGVRAPFFLPTGSDEGLPLRGWDVFRSELSGAAAGSRADLCFGCDGPRRQA